MAKRRKKKNPDGGIDLDREDTTLDDYANVARRHPAVREVKFDGSIVEVDLNNGKWMLIAHPETLNGHYGSPFRTPGWVPDPEFWFGLWVMGEGDAHGSTLYNTPERLQNKLDVEGDYLSNPRGKKKRNPTSKSNPHDELTDEQISELMAKFFVLAHQDPRFPGGDVVFYNHKGLGSYNAQSARRFWSADDAEEFMYEHESEFMDAGWKIVEVADAGSGVNPRGKSKRNPDRGWARGYGKPKLLPRSVDYWWHDGHGYEVGYEIGRAQGQRDSYGNWERGEMTPFATVAVDGPVADNSLLVEVYMGDDLIDLREVESTFDREVKTFGDAYRSLSEADQEAMGGLDQKRAKIFWDAAQAQTPNSTARASNPSPAKRMMNPHNY